MDSIPYLTALLPVSDEVRMRCHLHSLTIRALSMADSTETLTLSGQEAAFSDEQCFNVVDASLTTISGSTTIHLKAPAPYARVVDASVGFGGPPHTAMSSLSVAAAAARMKLMTKQKSWTSQGGGFDTDHLPVPSR